MSCDSTSKRPLLDEIEALVVHGQGPLPVRDLENLAMARLGLKRRDVRRALRTLIDRRRLAYRVDLGHTFVTPAFDKPLRFGARIVVKPEGQAYRQKASEIVVILQRGVAFGYGSHPTTRLCLEALDDLYPAGATQGPLNGGRLCDVGTGSGILALAGLKLGFKTALAIDTDPCARHETLANARLNRLHGHIIVSGNPLKPTGQPFDLITANLRWPTLSQLGRTFSTRLRDGGALVASGLHHDEARTMIAAYRDLGMVCCRQRRLYDWSGVVFRRAGRTSTFQTPEVAIANANK